jgi:hypothetical protein
MRKPCRVCRRPSLSAICDSCKRGQELARPSRQDRGYDTEYDRNARAVRDACARAWAAGGVVTCVICQLPIAGPGQLTVEHRRPVRDGGGSDLLNLAPAHGGCNYGWRARRP